jgi:hypothetical protein
MANEAALAALMSGLGKTFKVVGGTGMTMTEKIRHSDEAVEEYMHDLVSRTVLVGIPASEDDRDDGSEVGNAARLYVHEYGAPEVGIPARPTLMPGIDDVQDDIVKFFKAAASAALAGDHTKVDQMMHSAGIAARDAVKARISSNTPPPLAERTIQDRVARGKTSTATLIDEGEMLGAINYVVEKK